MNIKLSGAARKKISHPEDIYLIMQTILLREDKIDHDREHLWTISLSTANKILNIEMVSMGSVNKTIVEPMEVFSIPLQKRAVKIMLIHNHPSGEINPSESDIDNTDRLIQCGFMLHVPVMDHLIITTKSFFSFQQMGLMAELAESTKYVPDFIMKERRDKLRNEAMSKRDKMFALKMLKDGHPFSLIKKYTGLSQKKSNSWPLL